MKTQPITLYKADTSTDTTLPIADAGIKAGFPSPAQDFMEASIDLNRELIRNPSATFFGRVSGDSMQDMGINDGDLLVIDKSREVHSGKVAVCFIDGEFTLKKIKIEKDCCWLIPANDNYAPIRVTADNQFLVWGILIHVIKSF